MGRQSQKPAICETHDPILGMVSMTALPTDPMHMLRLDNGSRCLFQTGELRWASVNLVTNVSATPAARSIWKTTRHCI